MIIVTVNVGLLPFEVGKKTDYRQQRGFTAKEKMKIDIENASREVRKSVY